MPGTTISTSGTLTQESGTDHFYYNSGGTVTLLSWPVTISAGVTVTFGSNLNLFTINNYFIIGGNGVTIDGAGYNVNFTDIDTATPGISYAGFINGGSKSNSTVKNIRCTGNGINDIACYISRGNFTSSCTISNCSVVCSGFVFYGIAFDSNAAAISNCSVTSSGNTYGIVGNYNSGTISNCSVTSSDNISYGIVGSYNSGTISNCYVICNGNIENGAGIAGTNNSGTISNCYVICDGNIQGNSDPNSYQGGGIAHTSNSGAISNCYVICGGNIIGGGITTRSNSGEISNCYVICGGKLTVISSSGGDAVSSGGISGHGNSGAISNCYVILGGDISSFGNSTANGSGGIVGANNSAFGIISNCYVILGGDIVNSSGLGGSGGIAGSNNAAAISKCYVICGGDIFGGTSGINGCGGITGSNNNAVISLCYVICGGNIQSSNACGITGGVRAPYSSVIDCYVSYNTCSGYIFAKDGPITNCNSSTTPKWTNDGASRLTSSAWTNTDPTNNTPWILSAFDTAIASSTTAKSTSGTIPLNTYGQSFANGTVYSGKKSATFTYVAETAIAYSHIYFGTTYTLGLFGYNLLSNLSSFTFAFTNDSAIQTAFNYTGSSANNIVPYYYSVTDDVTLIYPIISGICFQEKTPIQTDQGIIPIEKINSDVNTINNKKIVGITKTISQDKYLVCFEKDSLGANYPTKSTTVSKEHKILYRGKLIEAEKFLGHFAGVKKVKYDGEVLYNVLMEKHEVIRANNLLCETLHPQNIVAKLYNSCMSESYKSKLTSLFNESILKNDHASYKKIVSRL